MLNWLLRLWKTTIHLVFAAIASVLTASAVSLRAADLNETNRPPEDLLLIDPLGQLVTVPTNQVPEGLLPPPKLGLQSQIPTPARGTKVSPLVWQRLHESRAGQVEFQFFPSAQPRLMPYLAAQDEFGNTAIKPNPLIRSTPIETLVQQGKYWLSEVGLRYSLEQTFTFVSMSDVKQGDSVLGFYTLD